MALNFLGNLGFAADGADSNGALGGIAALLQSLSSGKSAKDALKRTVNQGMTPAEAQSMALIKALQDPNNSLVKANADAETRTGVEGLLKTLRAAQMMDKRGALRGHGATFADPERRDEFVDYAVSRGMGGIQSNALNTARSNIAQQAQGLQGFIPVQRQRQQDILSAQNNYSQYQNAQMGSGIEKLMSILKKPQQNTFFGNRQTPYDDKQWNVFLGGR